MVMNSINKRILLSIMLCIFSFSFAQQNKNGSPEGKLFIIGGGDKTTEMLDRMIKESGLKNGNYIVIFPQASELREQSFEDTKQLFQTKGIFAMNGDFQPNQRFSAAKVDSIKAAKLYFLGGGDQTRFMEIIDTYPEIKNLIIKGYYDGKMIAGTSAGASVMSQDMITGNQLHQKKYNDTFDRLETDNIETKQGLGLVKSAVIDQHFVKRSRYNRMLSLVIDRPQLFGIGIDESTAILVIKNKAEVVGEGQVIIFKNPKASKHVKGFKLGAKGIELDVYHDGQKFDL